MLFRATLVWLLLAVIATLNGAFRTGVLTPHCGESVGHVISTIILGALIVAVAWLTGLWVRAASTAQAWLVGLIWLLLTLGFEFLVGHFVFCHEWSRLLADYHVVRGRIWMFVLFTIFAAPAWAHHRRA
jgi:hypothetical protein